MVVLEALVVERKWYLGVEEVEERCVLEVGVQKFFVGTLEGLGSPALLILSIICLWRTLVHEGREFVATKEKSKEETSFGVT